jgi:hypothetical protein
LPAGVTLTGERRVHHGDDLATVFDPIDVRVWYFLPGLILASGGLSAGGDGGRRPPELPAQPSCRRASYFPFLERLDATTLRRKAVTDIMGCFP